MSLGSCVKRVIGLSALIGLTLPLAACFQPLYAPNVLGTGDGSTQLASIDVAEIPDRIGHFLHAELQFQLGGGSLPANPLYQLEVRTRQTLQVALVDRNTDRADSASQIVYADYIMRDKAGKIVTSGTVTAVASYDRSSQQFANLRASRNAEERAAKLLAEQIRIRISAALVSKT